MMGVIQLVERIFLFDKLEMRGTLTGLKPG